MDSRSASGPQQVGIRLRLIEAPRKLSYNDRICEIKALALAHAIAARRPCASSELRPVLLHKGGPLVSFRLVVGTQGPEVPSDETRHFCCKSQARTLETSDRH